MKKTYLKHFYGGSNQQKLCMFSKKAKVTCLVATFCAFAVWTYIFAGVSFPFIHKDRLQNQEDFLLKCIQGKSFKQKCPRDNPTTHNPTNLNNHVCPSYFRWIHEDLKPWREKGITRNMLKKAKKTAHFKLVIVDGKMYVEKYRKSIQTRDVFTLWGILQLLRLYPGKLPDLELMFDCEDKPVVPLDKFQGPNASPPPLFRYCSDQWSLDIVFPDWSFWGWAETNIKPWNNILKDIKEGNKKTKWKDRVPYAYWKGNPYVAPTRQNLLQCNVTLENDWNTLIYIQDWIQESNQGFNKSNLGDQCTHRGMVPLQHYWPIRNNSKCTSLKFAVEWGNNHTHKAQSIGEAGSKFIQEDLDMKNVYNYMFHLLNEYAKLLKFKPTIPRGAVEICPEKLMACDVIGGNKMRFMEESMVKVPSDSNPCTIPPPYEPLALEEFLGRKANSVMQVEIWEDEYWQSKNKGQ
ncbi:glycosyltransferase family 90 protein [Medicago truncatula]|uniref:Glycosyltransferase family 90 protein n=1 Tax=Medicago truncatula TaxID=3880 RepID=A0A072TNE5_MEDTR|nr:glycosyltransferase family 90 protein [Medicago truncatula]